MLGLWKTDPRDVRLLQASGPARIAPLRKLLLMAKSIYESGGPYDVPKEVNP